jgi:hypothetical protein
VNTKFVESLEEDLYGKVDVLCFNPPYVPTPSEEIGTHITVQEFCSLVFVSMFSNSLQSPDIMAHIFVIVFFLECAAFSTAGCGIEVSWAGGIDGREVTDQFLPLIEVCCVTLCLALMCVSINVLCVVVAFAR